MIKNSINSLQKSYIVALYTHKIVLKQVSFHSDSIIFSEVVCCAQCNTDILLSVTPETGNLDLPLTWLRALGK